jgi:dTDP-4-amino-4,6-dideoxygalactose transaminase
LMLDPTAAASACTSRTRAVITVNLFGALAPLPAVPCPVIEDAAHSLGAGAGAVRGRAATLSFFPTKNLGALGDAGAVLTDDSDIADRITLLRTHGARPKYHHVELGGNFRLDTLQAAVLHTKLAHLASWTASRRAHAQRYRELFAAANVPAELRLPADDAAHVLLPRSLAPPTGVCCARLSPWRVPGRRACLPHCARAAHSPGADAHQAGVRRRSHRRVLPGMIASAP